MDSPHHCVQQVCESRWLWARGVSRWSHASNGVRAGVEGRSLRFRGLHMGEQGRWVRDGASMVG